MSRGGAYLALHSCDFRLRLRVSSWVGLFDTMECWFKRVDSSCMLVCRIMR
jgi:hypothetical protein